MIVLDTNVVSEAMRVRPDSRVLRWLDHQPTGTLAITSITVAELLFGIRRLPDGKRRLGLQTAFEGFLARGLRDRILPFDYPAADAYTRIVIHRQSSGRRVEAFDAMIAGIALSRGAGVATRDAEGFADCGLHMVNPWD